MGVQEVSIAKIRRRLYLLGLLKIPMIGYVKPRVLELTDENVEVRIRLRRRTKNHLNSMYFGALAVGADLAAGVHAFYFAEKSGRKVSLAFKGIHGEFLKRAETDVFFTCNEGEAVRLAMENSFLQEERINLPLMIQANNSHGELVATFEMILSIKVKA
ncbi:MAG: hypothetical protein A3D92_18590 [Bacteroidetes bacterium RIFCSPHIGHO2_02_FULL_44_7]|nr:MAG: hypothetical protein A3D92_18590 [Bacteroidetes bacterium RIFCSPHIGHO2_02_FULL_44_7]